MKPIYIFLGTLVAAGASIFYSFRAQNEIKAVSNWQLVFEGVKIGSISFQNINLILKYRIVNRESVPLQIEKMRMEIYNQGAYLGIIETEKFTIRASGSDVIEIPAKIESVTLATAAINAATKNTTDKSKFELEFIGWADYLTSTFGNVVRYPFITKINLKDFIHI